MKNWQNIDPNFTHQLQQEWTAKGFSYEQAQEWINTGLQPTEANFAHWLTEEGYTPLAMLDFGDAEALRTEYQTSLKEPKKPSPPADNWPLKWILATIIALILIIYWIN